MGATIGQALSSPAEATEMVPHGAETPIACDMSAIPTERRDHHERLTEELFTTAVEETRELPDGYAFRVAAEYYPLVTEFVADERLCCPFFAFALEVTPDRGPIWLRITGRDGVKQFLTASLAAPTSREPG
ncbi:MAG TPA: hypothetical protein VER55_09415 [Ardenticatenaceae bacterium]|nr:hypothetical protein [Ardenticatenaceae bacterium]